MSASQRSSMAPAATSADAVVPTNIAPDSSVVSRPSLGVGGVNFGSIFESVTSVSVVGDFGSDFESDPGVTFVSVVTDGTSPECLA